MNNIKGLMYECSAVPLFTVCEEVLQFPIAKLCSVGTITPVPVMAKPKKPKTCLNTHEAADYLGVHFNTIYHYIKRKQLRAVNIASKGGKSAYRIYLQDLEIFKNSHANCKDV